MEVRVIFPDPHPLTADERTHVESRRSVEIGMWFHAQLPEQPPPRFFRVEIFPAPTTEAPWQERSSLVDGIA